MKNGLLFLAFATLFTASAALRAAPSADEFVLVRGEGVSITALDVEADLANRAPEQRDLVLTRPQDVQQIAMSLYIRRVLAEQARRAGEADTPLFRARLRLLEERALSDLRLEGAEAAALADTSALENLARATYRAQPERFDAGEQVRARHILVRADRDDAEALAREILAEASAPGADFADLARRKSDDVSSAARGGDLGAFGRNRMVPAFESAAFGLKAPGLVPEPVQTEFGYHVILVEEIRPAGRQAFEDVRASLLDEARTALAKRTRFGLTETLEKGASIDGEAIERYTRSRQR